MLRFAEYLELQDFRDRTSGSYYRAMRILSEHYGKDPEGLSEVQLRAFFVHLRRDRKWAPKSCRQMLAAVKHFYRGMLHLGFESLDEIKAKDYSLVPSKYIEFVNRDENIDFDEKMAGLRTEFTDLLKAEEASKTELLNVFRELGYEIKL